MSYCFDYIRDFVYPTAFPQMNTLKLFIDLLDGLEIQKKLPTLNGIDIKILHRIDQHF